jgi:hypothetical protein
MNNDAFQKLVRERAVGKSTKEIARTAVEDEWHTKNKKRRRGEDSSDDSGEDEQQQAKSKKEHRPLFRPSQANQRETLLDEEAYRDRAKERREGKEVDNATPKVSSTDQKTDASARVPRKGLDLTLARQAKQELQAHNDHEWESSIKKVVVEVKALPSMEEAKELLKPFLLHGGNNDSSLSSYYPTLRSGMVEYLAKLAELTMDNRRRPKKVNCGVAGKALQRSRLAMAMDGHPSDYRRAWELPREILNPNYADQYTSSNNSHRLGTDLIQSIDRVMKSNRWSKVVEVTIPHSTKRESSEESNKVIVKQSGPAPAKKEESDNDDDDDIFGGLDNYVPPKPKTSEGKESEETNNNTEE